MRRLVFCLALLAALSLASSAGAATVFLLKGRGWGHGVGMSQWGAYAMAAKQGKTYPEILAHYYRDTSLATRTLPKAKVLLAEGRASVTIGSDASFGVNRKTHAGGNALVRVTKAGRIKVEGFRKAFASPATFKPTTAPLRLNGSHYRGRLVVSVSSGRLRVVNVLAMDAYVKGVVPRESPSWWPPAALRAQAVAARSYALALPGKCGGAYCPDTRDQVYGGLDGEEVSTNEAVDATAGQVLVHGGAVIPAYFHSSSGGRTAASVDVWSCDCAYLQSVKDFDLVAENPQRVWFVRLTPRQLSSRVGGRIPDDATLARDGSGLAQRLTTSGPWGSRSVEGSETLRFRLGLKSARFWVGVVGLTPRKKKVVFRTRTRLDTFVRGSGAVDLQARPHGSSWRALAGVANGAGAIRVKPGTTTRYRLVSSWGRGAVVRVRVAARVNFALEQPSDGLRGVVRPARLAGSSVVVQRRQDGGWTKVADATVGSKGIFEAKFTVRPGKYRAVVKPSAGSGLVKGKTPVLTLKSA